MIHIVGLLKEKGEALGDTEDDVNILGTADVNEKPIFSDRATENHADDGFGCRSDVHGATESSASQWAEPAFAQLGGPALQIGSWLAEIQV